MIRRKNTIRSALFGTPGTKTKKEQLYTTYKTQSEIQRRYTLNSLVDTVPFSSAKETL